MFIRRTCFILFATFAFCYVYCYQADVLAYLQQTLSDGQTRYERTTGAVVITVVLLLLQRIVYGITRLKSFSHALTYFPSALTLAVLTDVNADGRLSETWVWVAPLLLIAFVFLVLKSKSAELFNVVNAGRGLFSCAVWNNLFTILLLFLFVILCSNTDSVFHNRLKMERLLVKGRYEEAARVGEREHETDSSLTMLRVYALARTGTVGDRLFSYPLVGDGRILLPNDSTTRTLTMHEKIITAFSRKKGKRDYRLIKSLLNRDLDTFVRDLSREGNVDSLHLPKHYREALVIYTHTKSSRLLSYHDDVLDADYEDFRKTEKKYPDGTLRANAIRDVYGNTYWCYYEGYAK